jgi:hypothetical protein
MISGWPRISDRSVQSSNVNHGLTMENIAYNKKFGKSLGSQWISGFQRQWPNHETVPFAVPLRDPLWFSQPFRCPISDGFCSTQRYSQKACRSDVQYEIMDRGGVQVFLLNNSIKRCYSGSYL